MQERGILLGGRGKATCALGPATAGQPHQRHEEQCDKWSVHAQCTWEGTSLKVPRSECGAPRRRAYAYTSAAAATIVTSPRTPPMTPTAASSTLVFPPLPPLPLTGSWSGGSRVAHSAACSCSTGASHSVREHHQHDSKYAFRLLGAMHKLLCMRCALDCPLTLVSLQMAPTKPDMPTNVTSRGSHMLHTPHATHYCYCVSGVGV